jgi:ribosomal-protein-alanine N-acetyltransferase
MGVNALIEAGTAYAQALAALHAIAFPEDKWDAASFTTLLGQPGVLALVDARGGFLLLRTVLDEAEILTIGVTARRQGIGLALMQAGIQHAAQCGVLKIHLEVAANNAAARGLYARVGFMHAGRRKKYYPDGGDALTLVLEVQKAPAVD